MKLLEQKAKNEIIDRIKTLYRYLPDVKPGKCRYNYQCFDNAVHEAIKNNWSKVVLTFYIRNQHPVIHCINENEKGELIDHTFGHLCKENEYYFVRYITKEEFPDRWSIQEGLRKEVRRNLNWWLRLWSEHKC